MKKKFLLLFAISLFIMSCNKQETADAIQPDLMSQKHDNLAIPLDVNAKSLGGSYSWIVRIGHPGASCSGCVVIGGNLMHLNCKGAGNDCVAQGVMILSPLPNGQYQATTTNQYDLTDDDLFLMPDRSLYVGMNGSKEIWLNISEQLIERDDVSGRFVFDSLFFTDYQAYLNQ